MGSSNYPAVKLKNGSSLIFTIFYSSHTNLLSSLQCKRNSVSTIYFVFINVYSGYLPICVVLWICINYMLILNIMQIVLDRRFSNILFFEVFWEFSIERFLAWSSQLLTFFVVAFPLVSYSKDP